MNLFDSNYAGNALVQEPGVQNVTYIDLRNTLSNSQINYKDWWANEIHPNAGGIFGGQDGGEPSLPNFKLSLRRFPNHGSKARPSTGLTAR